MAEGFEQMWAALVPLGRLGDGGYRRLPWTPVEDELRAWFREACAARELDVVEDGFGNLVGWWRTGEGPGVLTGSHLDSVEAGGAFDGPLGVVSALAAVDRLRERGVVPGRPLGVAVFAAEEGSRFPVACLGSRLATGALTWERARTLRDADGVALGDLVAGEQPAGAGRLLDGVGTFVELHVEQGRALADLGAPVGVGSGIWPHGRWRFDFTGRADHAGTTRMTDRADPMLGFAMTALAAHKQARLAGQRATFGRVAVAPGSTNTIPGAVTGWLDARAEDAAALTALVETVAAQATARAERDGTAVRVTAESSSPAVAFDPALVDRLARAGAPGEDRPMLATQAGHDAGVLGTAEIATGMLFVRNPTGVSHAPEEHASLPDCLAGVDALAAALEELSG